MRLDKHLPVASEAMMLACRIVIVLALLALPVSAKPWGPFHTMRAPVTVDAMAAEPAKSPALPSADPMRFAFRVYQKTLSAQDGPRCLHHPTCSLYGLQMVRRHRVLGFFLTVDRIWRGHRSSALRPMRQTTVHDTRRYFDPVDANDFFLRDVDAREVPPPRPRQ